GITPTLAVVLIGDSPASKVYVRHKKKGCEYVGLRSVSHEVSSDITEKALLSLIEDLNKDKTIHGILVQLPLPSHIDEDKVIMAIDPSKDVDGFHPMNVGNLSIGRDGFVSCTPAGIMVLLERTGIDISGKKCVIIGRSNIVGKPIGMLLTRANGTVTMCHSRTKDLQGECRQADILIAAIGKEKFITKDFIKEGAVIIDVGINRLADGTLCGDVDFDDCIEKASFVTPVPKGVGPMTITMLLKNCIKAAKNRAKS
nr:bifunctional methylenetetrahydrofolate dehydrogenase/methenyltetrahydrofolate cyclohydrolase FolD [Vallitaleaceae bacterium]